MDEELVGHLTSNPNKIKILEVLKSRKEAEMRTISKFSRIPEKILDVVVNELKNDKIVEEIEGKFRLTDKGLELFKKIKSI
ncbi:MAG TPA: hypothetical protein EYP30_05870 [Archaeoglobaceae archaeon]|nr:hypothetical protein [Archaeoglobaceae archaeon]